MRVFVVGTGRCGTSTFYNACKHITNYTASHERGGLSERRSVSCNDFRDNHIYIDSTLYAVMGTLIQNYPDSKWVHLIRDPIACSKSMCEQAAASMEALGKIYFWGLTRGKVAQAYWIHCNNNISTMLSGVSHMTFPLESAPQYWPLFWNYIDAVGDFEASCTEWTRKYNSSQYRGRDVFV